MLNRTPPEPWNQHQRIYLQHNHSTVKHYSLILARASNLTRAGNLARAGKFSRAGRTFRAKPLGVREPPELPSQAPGNPLHDPLWSSPYYIREPGLSTTQKGWVSPITRKGLSLLPTVARRHQHLPLERQPRSPERSTLFPLSILGYTGLFRTPQTSLPDSTPLQWILLTRPTLSPRTIQLFTARLSSLQNSVHPNVSDPNNEHLNSDKSRNNINLRNTHNISMNTIIRLLYHIT